MVVQETCNESMCMLSLTIQMLKSAYEQWGNYHDTRAWLINWPCFQILPVF